MMSKSSKILVVGHEGVITQSLTQALKARGFSQVVSSAEIALDTTVQNAVYRYFSQERPAYVFLTSVRSGGIEANQKCPAEFFYANSESQNNVVYAAHKFGVNKLMYVASSCVYPKESPQPLSPGSLMTAALEETSASYAMAKLSGIELCRAFKKQYRLDTVAVVPATVYGPAAHAHPEQAHVLDGLIEKFYSAKANNQGQVTVWGSGRPKREFIFSEDFADACLFLMDREGLASVVNIGCAPDVTIEELARAIKAVSGFSGEIVFDAAKPDGVLRKLLDSAEITKLGWKPKVSLREGLRRTWEHYEQEQRKDDRP